MYPSSGGQLKKYIQLMFIFSSSSGAVVRVGVVEPVELLHNGRPGVGFMSDILWTEPRLHWIDKERRVVIAPFLELRHVERHHHAVCLLVDYACWMKEAKLTRRPRG